ncbi:ATP-binding protein [Coleofasciculus sp. FACHB-1120]|uniref:hybrid sensor histidine kinase/response regulator n=1 Tax=Coleofasciculus sp. FACHB-1120 TaxID=2692783 RepID=UPI001685CF6A|nr:ATP-binding protein [Coleofasciculus sp. FACHB-1120]MBD2743386.1 response regulator [Coleofasciculus sp. FACHB-1120]
MYKTPIQVLLVEDSPSDANLLRQLFSRSNQEGWQLVHVERLGDAIDACSAGSWDVALLDLSLPDSDGLDTVAQFRAAAPDIPIVVLTGFDDEELALQALATGAQDYLVKNQITMQLLMRTIRYAIERGQILKQLHESERRFRGIFEQTFQLMGLLTPEGKILEVNQTVLNFSGLQSEDYVGHLLWQTKCWNYCQESQDWLKNAIAYAANGHFVRHEIQVQGDMNVMLWIDFSLKPLTDETGKVVLLIVEGRDISDRKLAMTEILKALEQERELNQLKSNFVSIVSHEFRTPMTTIRMSAELLRAYNQGLTEQKRSEYFERIETAISNMLHLLDEVLVLGQTQAGGLQFKPAQLDLEKFCRDLIATLQANASRQHNIIFSCQGKCPQVEMDEVLMQHIFTNLLSNAIKYSPEGGNIHFDVVFQNRKATFRLKDEGIGIPLKDKQRLFETFHRCSNVGRIQGTGLGLSIAKMCVDLHQGEIQVESEVGVGTTFIVTLPFTQPPGRTPPQARHLHHQES